MSTQPNQPTPVDIFGTFGRAFDKLSATARRSLMLYGPFQSGKSTEAQRLWQHVRTSHPDRPLLVRLTGGSSGNRLFQAYEDVGLCINININDFCGLTSEKRTPVKAVTTAFLNGQYPVLQPDGSVQVRRIDWARVGMVLIEELDALATLMQRQWAVAGRTFKTEEVPIIFEVPGLDGGKATTEAATLLNHYGQAGDEICQFFNQANALPVPLVVHTTHDRITEQTFGKKDKKVSLGQQPGPTISGQAGTAKVLPLVQTMIRLDNGNPGKEYRAYIAPHSDPADPKVVWPAKLETRYEYLQQIFALTKSWGVSDGATHIKLLQPGQHPSFPQGFGIYEILCMDNYLHEKAARDMMASSGSQGPKGTETNQ